jgi:hypothetical protein
MKGLPALLALALAGCASAPATEAIYFPELAARVASEEPAALDQVLALSASTPPGEQLEELAELAATYVRPKPALFLKAQLSKPGCFGVSFLGPNFVDNPGAQAQELAARRQALLSVSDTGLAAVRARCLAELAGS